MSITNVGSSNTASVLDTLNNGNSQKNSKSSKLSDNTDSVNAQVASRYYASSSISFDYTSKDGDSVSFSMESVQYSESILQVASEGDRDDMKKLINFIKDNLDKMQKNLLKSFLKGNNEEASEIKTVEEPKPLAIPEEWNAENTSKRIFDFTISFAGAFKGTSDEFLSTIKKAIDEGFKQARDMMGDLPGEVDALVDETYKLVMEKLDAWGSAQNVAVQQADAITA